MRFTNLISLIILVGITFFLKSCGSGKLLMEKNNSAQINYEKGNYAEALADYQSIISVYEANSNSQACKVYSNAGISSFKMGNNKQAISYLKSATNTAFFNEDTYYYLALAYKEIDNISLELMTLQDYDRLFPQGERIKEVKEWLFLVYANTENYDKAMEIWSEIYNPDSTSIDLYETYLEVNEDLNNLDSCNAIASKILDIDSENIKAKYWFAVRYYRLAEDRYQDEMKAYDKNKTNKQYRILLKALDQVTIDFKKSLKYFNSLYNIDPQPTYANYLSHIYNRLGDKNKSAYYKKLSKK